MFIQLKTRRVMTLLMVFLTTMALSLAAVRAQDEKVLVIGAAEYLDSFDPARNYSPTGITVLQVTYDTLVTFPEDAIDPVVPRLAKSWVSSDDGLTYTFTLRDDVKFSDGTPLTSDDVVFSFNRFKNIKGNPSFFSATIDSVTAPDATTVVIKLNSPDPAFLVKLVAWAFSVVNKKQVMANGGTDAADAATTDTADAWFSTTSAGSGPYILESYEKASQVVLARNTNYWGPTPYYDRVIFQNIPESAAQKVALEAGDIDIAMGVTPDQVDAIKKIEGLDVYVSGSYTTHFLGMNRNADLSGPLSNPKVELAVRYALDYEGFLKLVPGSKIQASMLPIGMFGAYPVDKALKRDLDKAKALLEEAGYKDGFDTSLIYPTYTVEGTNVETLAQKIKSDLAEVGINVKLEPGDVGTVLDKIRAGEAGFYETWWQADYYDPDNYLYFLPGRNGATRAQWLEKDTAKEVLDLRDKALTAVDPEERVKLFAEVQDYWQQNSPFAPFLQGSIQIGHKANIQGQFYHPQWAIDVTTLSSVE